MKYFKLPDLGEGLTEAEIVRWHVKVGDRVEADDVLVELETDKAVVELPSPQAGEIAALCGEAGEIIHTGEPLVEFAGESDSATVVGAVREDTTARGDDHFIIGAPPAETGPKGEGLKGARRAMARNMTRAHLEVPRVFICDDADLHAWSEKSDPTPRLIRAVGVACGAEPALNAWFYGSAMTRRLPESVDLGVAVDTPEGLFVPVLRDIANRSREDLRQGLDKLREAVAARTIPPTELKGATITLSNFGTMAGRYANPIVMPPQVAIVGAGVIRDQVTAFDGNPAVHPMLPISLAFDHRAVTGGEAARFLKALLEDLERPE